MANENNATKEEKKVGFVAKAKESVKTIPEKHPKLHKVGKVAANVGKTALKAAFVAGAGTVAALTILDKTKGKSYATLPGPEVKPVLPMTNEEFKEAAENAGMEVTEF